MVVVVMVMVMIRRCTCFYLIRMGLCRGRRRFFVVTDNFNKYH